MTAQDPIEAFRAYAATCDAIQRRIIEVDNQPERSKSLRGFGLREVCRLLERDEAALRPLAAAAALFQPGGRVTISDIAELRGQLGVGWVNARRPPRKACVLTIANFKGGAAKSTTAVHLAQYLTLRGHRVCWLISTARRPPRPHSGSRPMPISSQVKRFGRTCAAMKAVLSHCSQPRIGRDLTCCLPTSVCTKQSSSYRPASCAAVISGSGASLERA